MASAFTRGSAPGRARDASERSGSFNKGHKKVGGRQKGTPNLLSPEYRDAVLEAAYRVGFDGNGQGGIVGYCMWIAAAYLKAYIIALIRLLELEYSYAAAPDRPSSTADEIIERLRKHQIGLTDSETAGSRPQPEPLDELIRLLQQPELLDELTRLFQPKYAFKAKPERPTVDEINERLRKQIGLTNSESARSRPKPELLDELIRIADEQPARFFKLVVALLPRPQARQKFGVRN
jgi:hypothetical protein